MTARLKANWFWPTATLLAAFAWLVGHRTQAAAAASWEYAVIFDVLVSLPFLFFICYHKQLSRAKLILRILALQCLGIWIAGKIVPLENQSFLHDLSWLRTAGLAVLIAIELRLLVMAVKLVFRADTSTAQLENLGMPPLIAKLALLEARFWRWVFGRLKP